MEYFSYGDDATEHLRRADERLGRIIDAVGPLHMPKDPDMFTALVRNIIGQQISIPVYERIWADFTDIFGMRRILPTCCRRGRTAYCPSV